MDHRRHFAVIVLLAAVAVAGTTWHRAIAASPDVPPPVAPDDLTDTGLYERDRPGTVAARNRPFSPQYPLWTDGASKARWMYLPPGQRIDTHDIHAWDFPVGTKFWKEFAFGGRKAETRFLWKAAPGQWVFASYVWNADGTAAAKAPDEGVARVAEVSPGKFHNIPAVTECRACHVSDRTQVLGFNALQLSTDRDPNAIHGEPLHPDMMSMRTLHEEGLLHPARPELVSNPPRIAARSPEERAVLGYLSGNCGSCHNRRSDLAPLGLFWQHGEVAAAGAGTVQSMLGHATKWQVPGVPEGESVLVDPMTPENSALLRRMKSRFPASQMPPLGTVVRDREAVEAMARWIARQREQSGVPATSAARLRR